ncbi:MAG: RloB family protein [Bacillota bacterium]|nr:RloB family protein [Bacillota bacterium]
MGSDDLFKKKRAARKARKAGFLTPKANSYLIVTEGTKTEPSYFEGLREAIIRKNGGQIGVRKISDFIDIRGEGCSTERLIEITEQIVKKANIIYQNVWVVFDKDDFDDFDQAIKMGEAKGYKVAWSNQSFEYWLYLHFRYSDSALHRDEWTKKLDEIFKEYGLGDGKYRKNYENIYELVDAYNGVNTAIRNAKRRMKDYEKKNRKPSGFDPGTTVHELVEELKNYIEEGKNR